MKQLQPPKPFLIRCDRLNGSNNV